MKDRLERAYLPDCMLRHAPCLQAKTIGQERENKNIVATIFGTVLLIWLAFGFSVGALLALGIAGSIAALLSRYSRSGLLLLPIEVLSFI